MSIVLYIHKSRYMIQMTVLWVHCNSSRPRRSPFPASKNQIHPFLSPLFSPAAWKQRENVSCFSLATHEEQPGILRRSLTPGLWRELSCRPNRPPAWPACIGEAVAEDSRLGDWATLGEFGVEVSAPLSVRRCSSLCCCCCRIWHTTTCCSWWGTENRPYEAESSLIRNINYTGRILTTTKQKY